MTTYPQTVALPDGSAARVRIVHTVVTSDKGEQTLTQLVSIPPQYERCDGTTVPIDVVIPDDLAARWFWFGSALVEDSGLVLISTASYPPPGLEDGRVTCFDAARRYEARQCIQDALRTERRALPQKKARKCAVVPPPVGVAQAVMELV